MSAAAVLYVRDLPAMGAFYERCLGLTRVDVASIEALRAVVGDAGGSIDPTKTAWEFRAWRHVDGVDPEGNVVQLRERL